MVKEIEVRLDGLLIPSSDEDNPPSDVEFRRRLDLVEAILVNKFPQLSFEEVRQMLDLKEVNFSETRFYQDVLQKGREQELEQSLQREVVGGSLPEVIWFYDGFSGVVG